METAVPAHDVDVEPRGDALFVRNRERLGSFRRSMVESLDTWAAATPDRVLFAQRDADEGAAIGISQYRVASGEGVAKAIELAQRIAANAPMTNFAIIHALPRTAEGSRDGGYLTEALVSAIAQGEPEAKERVREFLEKRAAKVR